ncbi:MAG TPA: hemerythrin domain-containing protein [Coleofasciculaceae cyanobacterium]|jgi:hemerythrin-like domain-containing protein
MALVQWMQEDLTQMHRMLLEKAAERTYEQEQAEHCCEALWRHIYLEEETIFPALRKVATIAGTLNNFEGDHHLMRELIETIQQKKSDDLRGTLVRLHLVFSRHMDEEERWLLPLINQNFSPHQQEELVMEILRAEQQHPPSLA